MSEAGIHCEYQPLLLYIIVEMWYLYPTYPKVGKAICLALYIQIVHTKKTLRRNRLKVFFDLLQLVNA